MTLEEMDAELAALTASLRRMRDSAIAEHKEWLTEVTNPYTRELLERNIEKFSTMFV